MWKVVKTHSLRRKHFFDLSTIPLERFYRSGVHSLLFRDKPSRLHDQNTTYVFYQDAKNEANWICNNLKDSTACSAFPAGYKFLMIEKEIKNEGLTNVLLCKVILENGKVGWIAYEIGWIDDPYYILCEIAFTHD